MIRLLRERGLGNGPTQLRKKIAEQVGEDYLSRVLLYLQHCDLPAAALGWQRRAAPPPPPHPCLPGARWLMTVYLQDTLTRQDEFLAAITSVTGQVLKIDSTRKAS